MLQHLQFESLGGSLQCCMAYRHQRICCRSE